MINEVYLNVNKTERAIAEYEIRAEDPMTYFDYTSVVSVFTISCNKEYKQPIEGKNSHYLVLKHITGGAGYYSQNSDEVNEALDQFFTLIDTAYMITILASGVYIFYAEVPTVNIPQKTMNLIVERYDKWYDGLVYTVRHQELVTWTNNKGGTMETWEDLETYDSVYGNVYNDEFLKEVVGA